MTQEKDQTRHSPAPIRLLLVVRETFENQKLQLLTNYALTDCKSRRQTRLR